jgi:hypothetical protein
VPSLAREYTGGTARPSPGVNLNDIRVLARDKPRRPAHRLVRRSVFAKEEVVFAKVGTQPLARAFRASTSHSGPSVKFYLLYVHAPVRGRGVVVAKNSTIWQEKL